MSKSHAESFLTENGIHTVIVSFPDQSGVARGKRIPTAHFLRTIEHGIPFCKAALGWDIACDIFPGIPWASFDNGYPDFVARADVSTLRLAPWHQGTAWVFADLFTEHGEVVEAAPRRVLKQVLASAAEAGYIAKVGAELEFYLTDTDGKPVYDGIQCYSVEFGSVVEEVLGDIRAALLIAGVDVEAAGTEYGPAQIEINLAYDEALKVADDALFFKTAVREIAKKHGLRASFMAKPWAEESGNSFHLHQSLWSLDEETNLFADGSELAHQYLAGLLAHTRELQLLSAPNVNSYKRYREQSFAPVNVSWGVDNRTTSARALFAHGSASRIEHRNGGADANPYLLIAANVASGLAGIADGLTPPEPIAADAAEIDAPLIPRTLKAAVALFDASEFARTAFGPTFVDAYSVIANHEVAIWENAVTDWERDRYFDLV